MNGTFDGDLVERFVAVMDAWRGSRDGLSAFHDCDEVTDYNVDARERLTTWSRRHMRQFGAVHVLVRHRTVAWAFRILQMVGGGPLVAHHERLAYETALAKVRVQTKPRP